MRMEAKKGWLLIAFFLVGLCLRGQDAAGGYVISIEKDKVYLDLGEAQTAPGERFEVYGGGGYMTHPVTGKQIRKAEERIGSLEVVETFAEYSTARPSNPALLKQLKVGMKVARPKVQASVAAQGGAEAGSAFVNADRVPVVVAPAVVNDVVNNGHFGGYVADILMEQMLLCEKVRLLDRSVLDAQIGEVELSGDILDPATTIQRGQGIGAHYVLQTTMQKPDVANVKTGIPLASVMGAVQMATGTDIGAAYASNVQVATLRAAVTLSVRVVDLQTGEVVFMTSGKGEAKGKSQMALEYGALGGGQLNGGVEDFKQTVTGKAIQKAFRRIGRNLISFFNGETDKKVMGSLSGNFALDGKMYAKGYKLYMGTEKLDKDDISAVFSETPDLFFKYRKAKRIKAWGVALPFIGIGVGVAGGSCLAAAGTGESLPYVVCIIGGSVSVLGGIVLYCSGRQTMKNVAAQYNLQNSPTSYLSDKAARGVSLSVSPLGFRLTF